MRRVPQLRIEPGGFAERLRATHVVPLAGSRRLDGIWVEPLACILRAAERVPRGRVLVVGCGAIGQLWVQVLRGAATRSSPRTDARNESPRAGAQLGADADEARSTPRSSPRTAG